MCGISIRRIGSGEEGCTGSIGRASGLFGTSAVSDALPNISCVKDVCKIMGKLFEFQDEITNPSLKQKLYDAWGERGTLETTTRRITLTLKEMDILRNETKTRYVLHKISITTTRCSILSLLRG